jgi:hypothetical protein
MGSGQFDKAGILAADFSGLEAASPGFTVSSPVVFSPVRGGATDLTQSLTLLFCRNTALSGRDQLPDQRLHF